MAAKAELVAAAKHRFFKEAFEKEEEVVFHQRTHPVKWRKERIWNPPSERYKGQKHGKKILRDKNLTSSEFPLTKLGLESARSGRSRRPPRPAASQSRALSRVGREVGGGATARSSRGSMPASARSFADRDLGSARTSASGYTSLSSSSSFKTGRSVSTELIEELRDRKVRARLSLRAFHSSHSRLAFVSPCMQRRLMEELNDLEDLEREAVELGGRTRRSGRSSVTRSTRRR